jgi:hypothetical protein
VTSPSGEAPGAAVLRLSLLALALFGTVGAAADLAVARHWDSPIQLVPWAALALLGAATFAVALRRTRLLVLAARAVALVLAAAGAYGVYEHVAANHAAGALDARYSATWEGLSAATQWWLAASGGVGPSPSLAPGVLAFAGLCLAAATLAHPALRPGSTGSGVPADRRPARVR